MPLVLPLLALLGLLTSAPPPPDPRPAMAAAPRAAALLYSRGLSRSCAVDPFQDIATLDPVTANVTGDGDALHLTVLAHWHPDLVGAWTVLDPVAGPVGISRSAPLFEPAGVPLSDPYLSRRPVKLTDAGALGLIIDVRGTSIPVTVDGERVASTLTIGPVQLALGAVIQLADRVSLLLHMRPVQDAVDEALGLIGRSPAMAEVRRRVRLVADLDVPVLIRGQSGVGKELVAQAIHQTSARRDRPLVAVNMAAVPPQLAASTLFGHRKGAFSGATTDHDGHFVMADRGTLFMDEVGDTPSAVQVMLLRTLETGEVHAIGGRAGRAVDVRVIAATDADLEDGVAAGSFRAPLLHRLAGFVLPIAPLAGRREDIGRLVYRFIAAERAVLGRPATPPDPKQPFVPAAMLSALARADLPGNVRQLKNIVRQAVILHRDQPAIVDWHALVPGPRRSVPLEPVRPRAPAEAPKQYRSADDVSEDELVEAMRQHRYQAKAAAKALGVSRTALYGLIERTDRLRKASELSKDEIEAASARCGAEPNQMADRLGVSRPALLRRMTALGLR